MSAVIETRADVDAGLEARATRRVLPSGNRISTELPVLAPSPLRQAKRRWNSSLSDQDLQCLLQIIEVDLVPRLLNGYSPARCAPDDRLDPG